MSAGRTLDGPDGPVRVSRVEGGVLHVFAESEEGRAFGLGWGHANDRIIQLDMLRVAGRGEVAERVADSRSIVQQDRFIRQRGFWHAAVRQTHALTPRSLRIAQAYAGGINRWLAQNSRPIELKLLRLPESPWQPADSVLIALLQSYLGLAQSQEVVERFIVQVARGGDQGDIKALRHLFAPHLDELDVALLAEVALDPLDLPIDPLCGASFRGLMGSNAYAIPPGRSASGRAIVGGEPHLDTTQLPPFFYECVLTGPDTMQAGATIPGVPGVIAGRWTRVAAAVTYGFVDQIDYFVEEVADGQIRRGDEMTALVPIEETIRRRGSNRTETVTVWRADGRLLHGDPSLREPQRVLGMQWALDGRGLDDVFTGPFAMETAADVDAARGILSRYPQSLQYTLGDVEGRTGVQQCGLAPSRADGHSGLNPQPGWDRARWWREQPTSLERRYGITQSETASTVLVTANETTNPTGGPAIVNLGLGRDRPDRIRQLLTADKLGHAQIRAVHRDRASLSTRRLLAEIEPYLPANRAGHLLRSWDGQFDPDLEAPSLFERFRATWLLEVYGPMFDRARDVCPMPTQEMVHGVERAEDLPVLWSESNSVTTNVPAFERGLLERDGPALGGRDWQTVLQTAMHRSLRSPARTWGRTNAVSRSWFIFKSAPPWLARLLSRRVGVPGAMDTPEQGRIHRIGGQIATVAPVWRMVADLGEEALHTALAGGPSDRLFAPRRTNDLHRFGRYELKRLDLGRG